MKLSSKLHLLYFFVSMLVSLGAINTVILYEINRFVEQNIYSQAYMHYMAYVLSGGSYKGDENFSVSENYQEKHLSYVFKDPRYIDRNIYVNINPEYADSSVKELFRRILAVEFFVVFLLALLYQALTEGLFRKIEEQEEWTKSLVASVAHKFGNFLSVQKVNLALLKAKMKDEEVLKRLERSLIRVERDMNLILNVLREERHIKREWVRLDSLILETLNYLEEEAKGKRMMVRLKEAYIYADETDLRDILYNIISNGIKHSKSFLHIKMCKTNKTVSLIFRNDISSSAGKGLGVGATLLERVVKRQKGTLRTRIKKHYTVLLKLRSR